MDKALATKLIRYYKWRYAETDPTDAVGIQLIKDAANSIRTQAEDANLLVGDDNRGWSPNSEDWTDVWDYANTSGNKNVSDWITKLGLYRASAPVQNVTPATPQGASSVNNLMQPSQAVVTQEAKAAGTWNSTPVITQPTIAQATVETPEVMNESVVSTYDPVAEANARFAEFQAASVRAGQNAISAEMAYANSILNSGGIWKVLQPIANKQMIDSMAVLEKTSAIAKANVEASRTALNAQEAADYAEVIDTIDKNLAGARKRTTEDMNARGLFFSTVLDSVTGQVEAASSTERAHAAGQSKARYAKIASEMAIMSGNIDIEVLKGNAAAVAQYTAQMLQVVAQDEQTKQEMAAIIAKLNVQKAGVADAIAAQVFGQREQMRSAAIQEGYQIEDRATAAQDRALTLEDRQTGIEDKAKNEWIATIGQFSGDFQAEINRISQDNDTSNDWQIPYLKAARQQKISDQLVAQAAVDADKAKADALAAYQKGQLSWEGYRAVTDRINATGSATGTNKLEKPDGGTSGSVWTNEQARSFKDAYEKVGRMVVGTTVTEEQAANLVSSGINISAGSLWTQGQKDTYLKQNKGLYDSAMDIINRNTTTLWSPKNAQLSAPFRAMLQGMVDAGIPINEANIQGQINAQADDTAGLSGAVGGPTGAMYDFLMAEFSRNK
jgi:hypothetical protein